MNKAYFSKRKNFNVLGFNLVLIGSLLVFVFLIGFSVYNVFQSSKRLNSDIDTYKQVAIKKQKVISDAQNLNSRIKSILFLHLLADYETQMTKYKDEFMHLAAQNEECFSQLDTLLTGPEEIVLLKDLNKFKTRLFSQRNYFLGLSENNHKSEAKAYYSRSLYYAYSLYTVQLQNLAEYTDRASMAYYDVIEEQINDNYHTIRKISIGGIVFVIVLVLLVSGVTNKIKKDNDKLNELVSIKERAEAEVRKLNDELESKVIERTRQLKMAHIELEQQIEALNVSAIVTETNSQGIITFVNDNFCTISGYSSAELIGANHRVISSGFHPKSMFSDLYHTVLQGKIWKADVKNKAKDGSFFWLDTTIVPFIDDNGAIEKLVAIRFDITKQKELQYRLQEQSNELSAQSEELRVQQEELHEANTILTSQAKKLIASEEELRMQQEELMQSNQELEEKSQMLEERNMLINKKNNELEIKSAELAQSSKYKSEFLANMSHELRTPLNSILLLSKLLADNNDGNLNEDQIEYAGVINSSGTGLLELINEILDLSKIEAGKMDVHREFIPVSYLCKTADNIFKPLAKNKGITYLGSFDSNVPESIFTDRMRVEQVIKNLISNAIKFTETGGVTLKVYVPAQEYLQSLQLQSGEYVAFEVKDTGIGIAPDKLQHVFEAFQQADGSTRRKYGGTGLGLSISREIAHLLQGEIELKSEPGVGSTFTFVIPAKEITPPAKEELKSNEALLQEELVQVNGNANGVQIKEANAVPQIKNGSVKKYYRPDKALAGKKILIVDDDERNIFSLKSLLETQEMIITTAANGKEALNVMNSNHEFDLVLMDMMMPEMDGYETVKELRKNTGWKKLPVIALTAKVMKGDREKCMDAGASDYLTKPVVGDQLLSLMKVWLYK